MEINSAAIIEVGSLGFRGQTIAVNHSPANHQVSAIMIKPDNDALRSRAMRIIETPIANKT